MMWWLPGEGMVASGFDELYNDLRVLLVLLKRRAVVAYRRRTMSGGGWTKGQGKGLFIGPTSGANGAMAIVARRCGRKLRRAHVRCCSRAER
jgi:hypothetical protein